MRRKRNPEIIAGRVNADGSIAAGAGFSVYKITNGKFAVTLDSGFKIISVTALSSGFFYIPLNQIFHDNYFEIMISNTFGGGSLVDSGFNFIAVGVQQ